MFHGDRRLGEENKTGRTFVIGPEDNPSMHPYFFWFCMNQLRDLGSLAKKPQMVCVDVRALGFSLQSGKDVDIYVQAERFCTALWIHSGLGAGLGMVIK